MMSGFGELELAVRRTARGARKGLVGEDLLKEVAVGLAIDEIIEDLPAPEYLATRRGQAPLAVGML